MRFKNKKATFDVIKDAVLQIVIVGLIFAIFLIGISLQTHSFNVKQQILQKQTALMIDSGFPGNEIIINKKNRNGYISELRLEENKIFILLETQKHSEGYPYFSEHLVELVELEDKPDYYLIKISKKQK